MLSNALSGFSRKKMSTVDTAWLRMDSDGNLMMIVGVSMFSKPVSVDGLKQALHSRFLVYSRFRSRVVTDLSGSWWQEQERSRRASLRTPAVRAGTGSDPLPRLER